MGRIFPAPRVKLVAGLLYTQGPQGGALREAAGRLLQERFGPLDAVGDAWDFTYTDYYKDELGEAVLRQFVSFERPAGAGDLAGIKVLTNAMEESLSGPGKRRINIDPGYVTLSKLVLATTKEGSYRVYMDKGIFGQSTLYYEKGSYRPWPWTYPDYRDERTIGFFNQVRKQFQQQERMARA